MKKVAIFLIFAFLLISFIIVTDQVGNWNYTLLKNEYIYNHSGQSIIPFPWEPSSSLRVLPFNYEIPAAPANNLSITACRDQFESASFIITAQKDLSGIQISVPTLYNAQGNSIPAAAINVRTVKVWYQASANDVWVGTPGYYLAPELLLKDDSLVKVDYVTRTNYLKVTINGIEQYIDISNPNAVFPSNAQIHDTPSLQPFSLKANENKQIWLTVHIPNNTPAGDYYGDITLSAPSETPVKMNFSVTVLPFDLEPSPIEYAIYYRGRMPSAPVEGISSDWKTPEQYSRELQNMKEHGVLYPTFYEYGGVSEQNIKLGFSLRNKTGLPTDRLYYVGPEIDRENVNDQPMIQRMVSQNNALAAPYGYPASGIYYYGMDEVSGDVLQSERTAMQTIHTSGSKVFAACYSDAVDIVGDLLDVAVVAGALDPTQAAQWHSYGKEIFSYANPQVGVENPELYRKNYGFALWNAGYDGAMDYAYQGEVGFIWNDYDLVSVTRNRDHVFAYPTSNGLVDTIQWEGWREGVDDTRYLASLMKKDGSDTSARALIAGSLSNGDNMTTIRKKVIQQILSPNH